MFRCRWPDRPSELTMMPPMPLTLLFSLRMLSCRFVMLNDVWPASEIRFVICVGAGFAMSRRTSLGLEAGPVPLSVITVLAPSRTCRSRVRSRDARDEQDLAAGIDGDARRASRRATL